LLPLITSINLKNYNRGFKSKILFGNEQLKFKQMKCRTNYFINPRNNKNLSDSGGLTNGCFEADDSSTIGESLSRLLKSNS